MDAHRYQAKTLLNYTYPGFTYIFNALNEKLGTLSDVHLVFRFRHKSKACRVGTGFYTTFESTRFK